MVNVPAASTCQTLRVRGTWWTDLALALPRILRSEHLERVSRPRRDPLAHLRHRHLRERTRWVGRSVGAGMVEDVNEVEEFALLAELGEELW